MESDFCTQTRCGRRPSAPLDHIQRAGRFVGKRDLRRGRLSTLARGCLLDSLRVANPNQTMSDRLRASTASLDAKMPGADSMTVRALDSMEDLEALADSWQHYCQGQPLRLFVVEHSGSVMGILPLYEQRVRLFPGIGIRVLRLIGTGGDTQPDYLGPLLEPACADAAATALAEHLLKARRDWRVILISDLVEESPFRRAMLAACHAKPSALSDTISARPIVVHLPQSWDDLLAEFSSHRRSTIRYARRKAESKYGTRFFVATDPEQIGPLFDELAQLHRMRFTAKGESHVFRSIEFLGFHRDVVTHCARLGWIRFYGLKAEGKTIALLYCYRFRNQVFYFQSGFDPAFEKLRPGFLLLGYAIEHAIGEGNESFDMMRGEHDYKTQWSRQQRTTRSLTLYRPGPAAFLWRARFEQLPPVWARLKRWMRGAGRARAAVTATSGTVPEELE